MITLYCTWTQTWITIWIPNCHWTHFSEACVKNSVHRGRHPPESRQPPGSRPPGSDPPPPSSAYSEIRATSGRYASYWNAYLLGWISIPGSGSESVFGNVNKPLYYAVVLNVPFSRRRSARSRSRFPPPRRRCRPPCSARPVQRWSTRRDPRRSPAGKQTHVSTKHTCKQNTHVQWNLWFKYAMSTHRCNHYKISSLK